MCGISGIISHKTLSKENIFDSLKAMKHRGPDDTMLFDGDSKVQYSTRISSEYSKQNFPPITEEQKSTKWFGFNRLTIIDQSHHGMQPYYDKERELLFMMNGEIYNYLSLKEQYLSQYSFFSNSDAEVGMKLFIEKGEEFVQYMRGMFAIAIYDFKNNELKLFRDRFGIKPIYYSQTKDYFLFASEIGGILKTNLISKQLNKEALAYAMYLGTTPAPLTLYKDINILQPGYYLSYNFKSNTKIQKPYWVLKYNQINSKKTNNELFKTSLTSITSLYNTDEVKTAISLSGGLDSGILAKYLKNHNTYIKAIHISEPSEQELEYTHLNAKNADIDLIYDEFIFDKNRELDYYMLEEEPNFILEPNWVLSKMAHDQGFKVVYNALGPDELFGGYDYFKRACLWIFFKRIKYIFPTFLMPKKWQKKIKQVNKFGIGTYGILSRNIFSWDEISDLFQKNYFELPQIHPIDFIEKQILDIYPEYKDLDDIRQLSYQEFFYYISSHHAIRNDRPSLLNSVEMRFPFLDHKFVEEYYNQKDLYHNLCFKTKPLFKKLIKNEINPKVMVMKKRGFTIQYDMDKQQQKKWYLKSLKILFPEIIVSLH